MFFFAKEIKTVSRLPIRTLYKIRINMPIFKLKRNLYKKILIPLMALLQKVSFCEYFTINTGLFSACRRKKIVFAIASLIISISFSCKKNNNLQNISDYKEFNRKAAHLTCEKIRGCYNYIYRTFPKNLLKSTRVEDCEEHVLQNLDEKVKNHSDKIQYYARICYTEILSTPCKNLPIAVLTNPNCNALKKEIGLQDK